MKEFMDSIASMNAMYKLSANDVPTLHPDVASRLIKFRKTLDDEIDEVDGILAMVGDMQNDRLRGPSAVNVLTAIADWLGDIVVFCFSEALKYGIPMDLVLAAIMRSNATKLGADGKPIYDANGKFLKGPNFVPPEGAILEMINAQRWSTCDTATTPAARSVAMKAMTKRISYECGV